MRDFIYLSRYAGMREDLVQAGGINSSVKISATQMLIKASGCQLAEVSEDYGWCTVNPRIIQDYFSGDKAETTQEDEKIIINGCLVSGKRPSIETFIHSITKKYTLHTHPTVVNILTSTNAGWDELKTLFPNAMFVEYATPGIKLAAEYFRTCRSSGTVPDTIFLKNHGLVVSEESAEFVKGRMEEVLRKIEGHLKMDMERHHTSTEIYDVMRNVPELKDKVVYLSLHHDILEGLGVFGLGLWDWQFCPDCIVYCGMKALQLEEHFTEKAFESHMQKYALPVILVYKGHLYILADSMKKAKDTEAVLAFSAQVALANRDRGLPMNLLPGDEQGFLLNWDAEKYRQDMK